MFDIMEYCVIGRNQKFSKERYVLKVEGNIYTCLESGKILEYHKREITLSKKLKKETYGERSGINNKIRDIRASISDIKQEVCDLELPHGSAFRDRRYLEELAYRNPGSGIFDRIERINSLNDIILFREKEIEKLEESLK